MTGRAGRLGFLSRLETGITSFVTVKRGMWMSFLTL